MRENRRVRVKGHAPLEGADLDLNWPNQTKIQIHENKPKSKSKIIHFKGGNIILSLHPWR